MAPMYIKITAIADVIKSKTDDKESLDNIEYTKVGNGMNNKNNTAKKLPMAILAL